MSAVAELKLHSSGKVREIYEVEDDLLMVASDRISAYDVILPDPIPDKGKVLTQMSVFWFGETSDIVPNHFLSEDVPEEVAGRAIRVRKLQMYPVECVVRGYLSGSGWREYRETQAVCGIELPAGLSESEKLPEPIFTPATKAELGDHDENVDFDRAAAIVGDRALMEELRRISIELYTRAADHAAGRGIILADTKFELGASPGAEIVLGDEVLTPDSSRFWPADEYEPGRAQRSFDKQYVRDWLDQSGVGALAAGPGATRGRDREHPRQVRRGLRADLRQDPRLNALTQDLDEQHPGVGDSADGGENDPGDGPVEATARLGEQAQSADDERDGGERDHEFRERRCQLLGSSPPVERTRPRRVITAVKTTPATRSSMPRASLLWPGISPMIEVTRMLTRRRTV